MNTKIKLSLNGFCKDCEKADFQLIKATAYNKEKEKYVQEWHALCKYEDICQSTLEKGAKRYGW